jgi:integrase
MIPAFLAWLKAKRSESYCEAVERFLTQHYRDLHPMALKTIKRADIAEINRSITLERGPIAMNRARSAISKYFNWSIAEGLCEYNPTQGTNKNDEDERERVLEERELWAIWNTLPDNDFGSIVKLLALTVQRRDEIGGLPLTEINLNDARLEINGSRIKNGRDNIIHLSFPALAIVNQFYNDERKFLFGRTIEAGFSGWSNAKADLDAAIEERAKTDNRFKVAHWTLHDLRRTGDTIMNDVLSIPPHIVVEIVNHKSAQNSAKKGVRGRYNKAKYLDAKRDALNEYAAWLMKVVK